MMDDDERILNEAMDWLLILADRPADMNVAARFREWLAMDSRHLAAWQQLSRSYELIGDVDIGSAIAAPATIVGNRMDTHIRRRGRHRTRMPLSRPRRRVAIAATAVFTLIAAWLTPVALIAIRADHRTGTGELETVALADGSVAELGPQSAIRVTFKDRGRQIELLQGEALFHVQPDHARPFRVVAGSVTTTVLGTGFDVRRLTGATHVGVQHGRVRVDNGVSGAGPAFLTAGDEVRIDRDGTVRADHMAPTLIAAWALGEVNARDRTVAEVIDDIRPWYRGQIILMDEAIAKQRVNGIYNPRDALQAVRSLIGPVGGSVTQITPWLILIG